MSMNLYVSAKQKATLASGKETEIVKRFDLYQTPTKITYEAIEGDTLEVYCNWVTETCSKSSTRHLEDLKEWIKTMENEGYVIKFYTV